MKENPQKQHYESIHDDYAAHYYDETALDYRRKFLFSGLCDGLDLNGRTVADLACGDGHNSLILRDIFPRVELKGFDISPRACQEYRALVGAPATECDLLKAMQSEETFDAAMIVGGLHHCIEDLDAALSNCVRLLKPGGVFLAVEPNAKYILNPVRDFWYRQDHWFEASTEAPLDLADLERRLSGRMTLEFSKFLGGPAYFLVYNSLIVRFPVRLKQKVAVPLFGLETLYNLLPGRWPFPAFVSRWRRV